MIADGLCLRQCFELGRLLVSSLVKRQQRQWRCRVSDEVFFGLVFGFEDLQGLAINEGLVTI